jgi:hypothetical protein
MKQCTRPGWSSAILDVAADAVALHLSKRAHRHIDADDRCARDQAKS